jgi:hypothetical protein
MNERVPAQNKTSAMPPQATQASSPLLHQNPFTSGLSESLGDNSKISKELGGIQPKTIRRSLNWQNISVEAPSRSAGRSLPGGMQLQQDEPSALSGDQVSADTVQKSPLESSNSTISMDLRAEKPLIARTPFNGRNIPVEAPPRSAASSTYPGEIQRLESSGVNKQEESAESLQMQPQAEIQVKSSEGKLQIPDFEVQQPFSMSSEQHRLIAISNKSKFQLLIASNPTELIPALRKAINEVQNAPIEHKIDLGKLLHNFLRYAENIEYDVRRDENDILKGVNYNSRAQSLAMEQEIKKRLADLANSLQQVADQTGIKSLDSLDKFYKKPPLERYIPEPEVGKFIRGKLYDQMHNWSSMSNKVINDEKRGLIDEVKEAQGNKDFSAWKKLKDLGKVETNADIENYKPEKVMYHVDHRIPVTYLWNEIGWNKDDSERGKHLTERSNLRLVTEEYNLSKGSTVDGLGPVKYKDYVGPNFTSEIAEGGIEGARKIDGKPFLDAARKPLV